MAVTFAQAVLAQLRRFAGSDCRIIIITTIYDPTDGTGDMPSALPTTWPEGLQFLTRTNAVLNDLADRHGGPDSRRTPTLRRTRQPRRRLWPDRRLPTNRELWYCGAVEPNGWGAHELRRIWWQHLHS